MEIIVIYIESHKIINRGFLIGPYCPVYGTGAIFIYYFLQQYEDNILVLFVMAMFLCSLVEYFTGLILEKLFNTRWWDYSNKRFNLNGRICLENLLAFGLLGVLMIKFINPFILNMFSYVYPSTLNIIAIVIACLLLADYVISIRIITKFKGISKNSLEDSTELVTNFVRNEIKKKNKLLYNRLLKAFPKFKITRIKKKKH